MTGGSDISAVTPDCSPSTGFSPRSAGDFDVSRMTDGTETSGIEISMSGTRFAAEIMLTASTVSTHSASAAYIYVA